MFLKQIKLQNYRNYSTLEHQFQQPLTILVGDNAQGKSNFLEAIAYLATTKSLRADTDEQLISEATDFNRVSGLVEINNEQVNLEIAMQQQPQGLAKRVKVNGLPKRVVDYIGNLYVVSFAPEDIALVTASPSLRRWHVDLVLAQSDREYKKALTQYGEILTRKNKVLKRIREQQGHLEELDYWVDQQLILGEIVASRRQAFFEHLNQQVSVFPLVNETLEYHYQPSILSKERLLEYRDREIWSATSLVGPHRDDFKFISRNSFDQTRDLSQFGSRGEQRTAILEFKIREVTFIEHKTKVRPILLLDDVFSELDKNHRRLVMNLTKMQQTIMSVVEIEELVGIGPIDANLWVVENGQVSEITDQLSQLPPV